MLTYLLQAESAVTFAALAQYVVYRAETPADLTDTTFRGKITTRLVHSNLPKLADAGVIEYDDETRVVRPTPVTDEVVPYLALAMARRETESSEVRACAQFAWVPGEWCLPRVFSAGVSLVENL